MVVTTWRFTMVESKKKHTLNKQMKFFQEDLRGLWYVKNNYYTMNMFIQDDI